MRWLSDTGVCAGQPGYHHETFQFDERMSDDGEFVHGDTCGDWELDWGQGQAGSAG